MTYKFLLEYLNLVKNNLGIQRDVIFVLELDYNSYHLLVSDLSTLNTFSAGYKMLKLHTEFGEVEVKAIYSPTLQHKLTIK